MLSVVDTTMHFNYANNCIFFRSNQERRIKLHTKKKLGFTLDGNKIVSIVPNSQAAQKCIKVGWKLSKVAGVNVNQVNVHMVLKYKIKTHREFFIHFNKKTQPNLLETPSLEPRYLKCTKAKTIKRKLDTYLDNNPWIEENLRTARPNKRSKRDMVIYTLKAMTINGDMKKDIE